MLSQTHTSNLKKVKQSRESFLDMKSNPSQFKSQKLDLNHSCISWLDYVVFWVGLLSLQVHSIDYLILFGRVDEKTLSSTHLHTTWWKEYSNKKGLHHWRCVCARTHIEIKNATICIAPSFYYLNYIYYKNTVGYTESTVWYSINPSICLFDGFWFFLVQV